MKGDVLYYLKHVPQGSLDLSRVKRQLIIIPMGNNRHILEESLWRWKHNSSQNSFSLIEIMTF